MPTETRDTGEAPKVTPTGVLSTAGAAFSQTQTGVQEKGRLNEVCHNIVSDVFEFLDKFVPPERRIVERPEIKLISEGLFAGSHKLGSTVIEVDPSDGIERMVSHESYHFWQGHGDFSSKVIAFVNKKDIKENQTMETRYIITYAMLDAGAYFFDVLFRNKSVMEEGTTDAAKCVMREMCVPFTSDGISKIMGAMGVIRSNIAINGVEGGLEGVALYSVLNINNTFKEYSNREFSDDIKMRLIGTTVSIAVAMLLFAANEYDINKTMNALASSPEEILNTIGAMERKKVTDLIALVSGTVGESKRLCGIPLPELEQHKT